MIMKHSFKYGFAYQVCSKKCFSFGIHIDFRFKYVDLHIWNWFIHLGNNEQANIPKTIMDKVYKLQNECNELTKDWHAYKI